MTHMFNPLTWACSICGATMQRVIDKDCGPCAETSPWEWQAIGPLILRPEEAEKIRQAIREAGPMYHGPIRTLGSGD